MQKTFSDLEYAAKKKLTRRDRFLAKIDSATPWSKLHELIEPNYPKVEGAGRDDALDVDCLRSTNSHV
jgi:IS5 family transposase